MAAINQLWLFQPTGRVTYVIMNRASWKVLDIEGDPAATAHGAKLQQWWRIPNALNQEFRVEPVENGLYRIVAAHSGKALHVTAVSTAAGASVIQWSWVQSGGNPNQRFRLDEVTTTATVRFTCR
jgi:hypothetical protein